VPARRGGRKKNNIYGTLKDEIDKSREAYDRRFKQPQIQSRPYFHDATGAVPV